MRSSIYTRTGDHGETSLADDSRVAKDSARVEAYGTIDEANSWVGVARDCVTHPVLKEALGFFQHRLYNCSSNLAAPPDSSLDVPTVSEADIEFMEQAIDHFEEKSGGLDGFIIPGGNQCAAFLHVARTVVRRAERRIVSLAAEEDVDDLVLKFVNRGSDFLFAAARYSNHVTSKKDVRWDRKHGRPDILDRIKAS